MATSLSTKSVLADSIVTAATVVLFLSLGVAFWALFVRTKAPTGPPKPKPTSFTHLHCPACGDEIPYVPDKAKSNCSECKAAPLYVATIGTYRIAETSKWGKPIALSVICLVLIPAYIYLLIRRMRVLRRRADEAIHQRMRMPCPFCKRKVKFPPSALGTGHICSACKTAFVLEEVPEETLVDQRLVMACPFCGRHARFPNSSVGAGHTCTDCKTAFVLEFVEEDAETV